MRHRALVLFLLVALTAVVPVLLAGVKGVPRPVVVGTALGLLASLVWYAAVLAVARFRQLRAARRRGVREGD
jgi:hypothetical protein